MSDIRVKVLGDTSNFKSSMSDVERIAERTAGEVKKSFHHVSSFLKTTIGLTAVGVGMERAVESASQLVSLQKVQSQLIKNQGIQKEYALTGDKDSERWYSKRLDDMALELSIQNGINKASVVQAQTFIMSNQDLVKMTGSMKDGMKTVLQDAANIAEITGGNITSTSRMLTRMLANPSASMSSMRRMGFQLSQDEQKRIKDLQKSGTLLKAQQLTIELIGKHTKDIAKNAQSPVDLLKNEVNLVWQSLGMGLLPILENLAKALIAPIQALMPVLSFMGTTIKVVAEELGRGLGDIFKALIPLFQLMTNSIIPALLKIITPMVAMVKAVLTPLSDVFAKLVGTGDKLGPLAQVFVTMGDAINENLMKAVDSMAKSFNDMAKNGKLTALFNGLLEAFTTMAPVLPALAESFAELNIAFAPLLIATLPDIVELIKLFAKLMVILTPVLTGTAKAIAYVAENLGPLKPLIAGLLAVWFTRKLFLTPISIMTGGITGLIGKFKALQQIMMMTKISTGGNIFSRLAGVLTQRGGAGAAGGAVYLKAEQALKKLGSALSGVGGKVRQFGNGFVSVMSASFSKVGTLAQSFGSKFASTMGSAFSKVSGMVKIFATKFIMVLGVIGAAVKRFIFQTLIPAFSSLFAFIMANPIVLAIAAIVLVVAGLIYLMIKHWRGLLTAVKAVWNAIVAAVKFAWKIIVMAVKTYIKMIILEITILKNIFVAVWHGIYAAFKWVWDKISAGFNWLVGLFTGIWHTITSLGKSMWNGLVNGLIDAVNKMIGIWNSATGWIPWLGGKVQVGTIQHIGETPKKPIKRHNGGMVPGLAGREVPAILQAGEAVLTANQMRGMNSQGGGSVNVHPNAVNIVVHGNADAATTAEIKRHVEAQFKELHRTLKTMGR